MPTSTPRAFTLGQALRLGGLASLWFATAALMVRSVLGDPYDPTRTGTAAYGHNHEGALLEGLVWTFTEMVILYAILRPWSYQRSWGRSLAALALLAPWTALSMVLTMHAGGVVVTHFLWLAILTVIVLVLALTSGFAAITARRAG
ncbi:MAG: hypothetical protein R3B09_23970 [Nannocystaceae bacterium]